MRRSLFQRRVDMLPRRVVLLDSLSAFRPRQLPFAKQDRPVTPLAATLTRRSVCVDFKRLRPSISPLDATLTKYTGRVSHFNAPLRTCDNFPANRNRATGFLSHSCALFAPCNSSTPSFSIICALFAQNTRGTPPRPSRSGRLFSSPASMRRSKMRFWPGRWVC